MRSLHPATDLAWHVNQHLPRAERGEGGLGAERAGHEEPEGDRAGEDVMRNLIKRTFPAHGILGEEFGADHRDPGAKEGLAQPCDDERRGARHHHLPEQRTLVCAHGAGGMPGVIVPRKTVNELRKLADDMFETMRAASGRRTSGSKSNPFTASPR